VPTPRRTTGTVTRKRLPMLVHDLSKPPDWWSRLLLIRDLSALLESVDRGKPIGNVATQTVTSSAQSQCQHRWGCLPYS
jgi:hypothetical protein